MELSLEILSGRRVALSIASPECLRERDFKCGTEQDKHTHTERGGGGGGGGGKRTDLPRMLRPQKKGRSKSTKKKVVHRKKQGQATSGMVVSATMDLPMKAATKRLRPPQNTPTIM